MVQTGTNLLGLVKHVASVEFGYFGDTFGRAHDEPLPWFEPGAEPNADMWAMPDESRQQIVGMYRRAWAHADATIEALPLDATGHVPWWPHERNEVTLHPRRSAFLYAQPAAFLRALDVLRRVIAQERRRAAHELLATLDRR